MWTFLQASRIRRSHLPCSPLFIAETSKTAAVASVLTKTLFFSVEIKKKLLHQIKRFFKMITSFHNGHAHHRDPPSSQFVSISLLNGISPE